MQVKLRDRLGLGKLKSKTWEGIVKTALRSSLEQVPQFEVGKWLYVDKAPNLTPSTPSENSSRNPRPKKIERCQVKLVQSHTVAVKENGHFNTVPRNLVFIEKRADKNIDPRSEDGTSDVVDVDELWGTDQSKTRDEYVGDKGVRHVVQNRNKKSVVRWYGYTRKYNTLELVKHLPQHGIDRYLQQVRRQSTMNKKSWRTWHGNSPDDFKKRHRYI